MKINSKKITLDGHTFDSQTEAEYYLYLKTKDYIREIIIQPHYVLLEPFQLTCGKCKNGKVESPKTGKLINCKTCKGTGKINRQGWTYHADFEVWYEDDECEVIDVKGYANERFPLVKKMFEHTQNKPLTLIKKIKGKWIKS